MRKPDPSRNYSPGNWDTFPEQRLRVGKYFNPRAASMLVMLYRLEICHYYRLT